MTRRRPTARERLLRRCGVPATEAAWLLQQARRVGKRLVELGQRPGKAVRR